MHLKRKLFLYLILVVGVIFLSIYAFKSKKKPPRPDVTIIGSLSLNEGFDKYPAALIHILKDVIAVGFKPNHPTTIDGIPKKIKEIVKNKKAPLGKVILYQDSLGKGGMSFNKHIQGLKNQDTIRIAYSMFESSRIPAEWSVVLNYYFDAVAVPNPYLVEVYKNSGVTIPIFVLPFPLNLDKFYQVPAKKNKHYPLVFANFSPTQPGKNHLKLVKAFNKAFGNSNQVKLKLNSSLSDPLISKALKQEIRALAVSNIEFTEMVLEEELYLKTFQDIDCYVSLSQGESLAIQAQEALALGLPLLLTNNTAHLKLCSHPAVRAIPSPFPAPALYPTYGNTYGSFYDCSLEDAADALKDIYEHYDAYLQKSCAARIKPAPYAELQSLYASLVHPKKVILGATNILTPAYLMTTSPELCEKFSRLVGSSYEN